MRGQSEVLALVGVIVLVVVLTLTFYAQYTSMVAPVQEEVGETAPSVAEVPPQPVGAYSEVNEESGLTRVCILVQNTLDRNVDVSDVTLLVEGTDTPLTNVYSPDCNVLSPGSVCTLCADLPFPENESVRVRAVFPHVPATSQIVAQVVESNLPDPAILSLSFSNPLSFAPPHPDRYANVLFHGDSNAALFHVTVKNEGLVEAEFNVLISGPCIQEAKKTVTLAPDEETTLDIETATTTATPSCTVTASVEFLGPEQTTTNNQKSISVTIFHYFECNTATDCQNDLATARDLTDVNSVVLLTADIQGTYISFPSGDYGWRVTFDGNSHEVNNVGSDYALELNDVNGVSVQYISLYVSARALSIFNSLVSLQDINIHAFSEALHVEGSHITSASNAYCFFSGDPTPYPILSIDEANYDLNISAYLEENAPGSPALCHVSVLADGVKIHDGNVGAEKDGNYLSFGAIVISGAKDANVYNTTVSASAIAMGVERASAAVGKSKIVADRCALCTSYAFVSITDTSIFAEQNAIYLDNSLASVGFSEVLAQDIAIYLYAYGTESLVSSTTPKSVVSLYDVNVFAESNFSLASYCEYVPLGEVSPSTCTNDVNIHLSDGNVYIYSPGYDWYIESGTLTTHCFDCGTYCLDTNFDDKYGSGTIAFDPDANCLTCTCG